MNGKIIKHENTATTILINSKIPIEEVPECNEKDNVPNEPVVVSALNKIAVGVLDFIILFILL